MSIAAASILAKTYRDAPVQIPLTVNETPFIQQVSKTLKNRIRKRDELTDSKIVTQFW